MSRDDGFAVMDVSTDIINDPKVRKLWRHAPDHAAPAFVAYIATVAESWKAGRRVNIDDAWPALLPFDQTAVEALVHVGLLDRTGRVTPSSWRGWFESARSRRDASRERYRRANTKRHDEATQLPRGSDADTGATVPTVRPSVPTEPFLPARARSTTPQKRERGELTPVGDVGIVSEFRSKVARP